MMTYKSTLKVLQQYLKSVNIVGLSFNKTNGLFYYKQHSFTPIQLIEYIQDHTENIMTDTQHHKKIYDYSVLDNENLTTLQKHKLELTTFIK